MRPLLASTLALLLLAPPAAAGPLAAGGCIDPASPFADIHAAVDAQVADMNVVADAMAAAKKARAERRAYTAEENALLARADALVANGTPMPAYFEPICCFGYRDHVTYLSLANEGPGHEAIVLAPENGDLDSGLIVHHEHIDRETKLVAPYRYVSPVVNGKLLIRSAGDFPVTVFIGQPNFQAGGWANDKVTPSRTTAAQASAVFANGTADAKVTMDGLTASEAIEFMQHVKEAVVRREGQFLSAAFNVTKPLVDDRPETLAKNGGQPVTLTDAYGIAKLSVELTAEGGWEKVTWDGASDEIPSRPLLAHPKDTVQGRLTLGQLTEVVHDAHSAGLETYISAGMRQHHMEYAVYSGVDGVGIGTALHKRERTPDGGIKMGALDPALVRETLDVRDAAEASVLGRGARELSRLDSDYSKGTLDAAGNAVREKLAAAMIAGDEAAVGAVLGGSVAAAGAIR